MFNHNSILFQRIKSRILTKLRNFNYELNKNGQSILEIVVALGIFAIIAGTMGTSILGGLILGERSGQYLKASALTQEGLEAVRAIRNRDWDEIIYSRSAVMIVNDQWEFKGEGTTDEIDGYTRTIDFLPVYRDSGGELTAAGDPGAALDYNSREVRVSVAWDIGKGNDTTLAYFTYLTNWRE